MKFCGLGTTSSYSPLGHLYPSLFSPPFPLCFPPHYRTVVRYLRIYALKVHFFLWQIIILSSTRVFFLLEENEEISPRHKLYLISLNGVMKNINTLCKNTRYCGGTWVAQLAKHLTLDFSSDHDSMVCEFKPRIGLCVDSPEPAWDSLSLSLSLCPSSAHGLSFCLKIKKIK